MNEWRKKRPEAGEFNPYFERYISRVPDADIVETLGRQVDETMGLLRGLPESMGDHRYAPEKWSIREVIGHMSDAERVFSYRALRFARADTIAIEGFDENAFVANGTFGTRTIDDLASEFEHIRRAAIHLFAGLDEEAMSRRGVANGSEVSVRAIAFICAGHESHHVDILRTRYL